MRLSEKQIKNIKNRIKHFDVDAKIYLFGSRTNDNAKGGDIDLLIISTNIHLLEKIKIRVGLYDDLGEQKIDIITAKSSDESAFIQHAIKTGIQL